MYALRNGQQLRDKWAVAAFNNEYQTPLIHAVLLLPEVYIVQETFVFIYSEIS